MHTHTRMLLGPLTATIVLATAIGTASANRISITNKTFRQIWRPLTFGDGGINIACDVTLEGSFHYNTLLKVARSLVGYITKAAVAHPCAGSGEVWADNGVEEGGLGPFANSLPWHVTYEGFEGRLPLIEGFRQLLRPRFTLNTAGVLCKYEGNIQGVVKLTRTQVGQGIVPDEAVTLPKISGGFLCPASGRFTALLANSTLTQLGSAILITIRLI
jgi:hypothetical protein